MLLNVPAAHASCSGAGGRMANAQACSCTARSHAIWHSRSTRRAPRHVVASPARLHDQLWQQHARSPRQHAVGRSIVAASGAPSDVFILDFDGVLVDSEPEVSAPAWRLSACLLSVGLLRNRMIRNIRQRSSPFMISSNPVSGVNGGLPCSEEALARQCHRCREGAGRRCDTRHDSVVQHGRPIDFLPMLENHCEDHGAGAGGAEGDAPHSH
jgi:hypothetical protein